MFKSTKSATANAMVNAKASCAASMAASVLVINALSIQLGVFLISLISILPDVRCNGWHADSIQSNHIRRIYACNILTNYFNLRVQTCNTCAHSNLNLICKLIYVIQ